ncbi:hypothetical protein Sjap_009751 [Stephania japonica]|uniref:Flavin-containing monooxygenase n=1 Tax=Stephania japonica TaxID=461633 RepID=A0AAP0P3Z8_9MAGN
MDKRIAIIGAGISGLLSCKYVLEKGFTPVVFEADNGIGGVWTRTIETTKLQTPKQAYQFSDFPWPSSIHEEDSPTNKKSWTMFSPMPVALICFPTSNLTPKSLVSSMMERRTKRWIRGVSGVAMVSPSVLEENGAFQFKTHLNNQLRTEISSKQVYQAEFVILCVGRFSGLPKLPDFPINQGPEVFKGVVLHSMDYSAMEDASAAELIKGKRVAVVGNQKSGLDIAVECASANGAEHPCTLIYRTKHWSVPSFIVWGVPLALLYFNRFSELLLHKPGQGPFLALLAVLLSPLRWFFSKFVESYLRWTYPLRKYNMIPESSFLQAAFSSTFSIMPDKFYDKVEDGSLILKEAKRFGFCETGLLIEGESTPLQADVVIFATGYKGEEKLKNIFSSPTLQKRIVGSTTSTVPLYRECIHPRIPQLAVIGYSESLVNLYTSEMRCRWLSHLLEGSFKLPSIKEMEKDVLMWERCMKEYSGPYYRRSSIAILHIWYNDQLCKDMGYNPKRKKGFFAELFEPYGPIDYQNL